MIDANSNPHVSIQFLPELTVTEIHEFIVVVASEERKKLPEVSETDAIDSEVTVGVFPACSVTLDGVSVTAALLPALMSALSSASTRRQTGAFGPTTPRNSKISYTISTPPSATPSISSSTPFDWDAVRLRKPPPYGTPFVDKRLQALRNGGSGTTPNRSTPTKRTVRKKTMWQK